MRSLGIFLLSMCLMVSVSTSLSAHNDKVYHAVGIPDDRIPVIDGDLSDWGWVPERYIIRTDQMEDAFGGEMPGTDDLDCRIIVGWNGTTNLLYIAVSVKDDIHNADSRPGKRWRDDCLEIRIDANHNGVTNELEDQRDLANVERQCFYFSVPHTEDEFGQWSDLTWVLEEPYSYHGYILEGPDVDYEVALALWDRQDPKGPGSSVRHQLTSGQVIGLDVVIFDVDDRTDIRDCGATTGTRPWPCWSDIYANPAHFSDFILDSPLETNLGQESWGELKFIFK